MSAGGNALDGVSELLASFGVQRVDTRDEVTAAFARAASARGVAADVVGLRFETLTVEASSFDAQVLSFERDAIVAELQASAPGAVKSLAVRVRRALRACPSPSGPKDAPVP